MPDFASKFVLFAAIFQSIAVTGADHALEVQLTPPLPYHLQQGYNVLATCIDYTAVAPLQPAQHLPFTETVQIFHSDCNSFAFKFRAKNCNFFGLSISAQQKNANFGLWPTQILRTVPRTNWPIKINFATHFQLNVLPEIHESAKMFYKIYVYCHRGEDYEYRVYTRSKAMVVFRWETPKCRKLDIEVRVLHEEWLDDQQVANIDRPALILKGVSYYNGIPLEIKLKNYFFLQINPPFDEKSDQIYYVEVTYHGNEETNRKFRTYTTHRSQIVMDNGSENDPAKYDIVLRVVDRNKMEDLHLKLSYIETILSCRKIGLTIANGKIYILNFEFGTQIFDEISSANDNSPEKEMQTGMKEMKLTEIDAKMGKNPPSTGSSRISHRQPSDEDYDPDDDSDCGNDEMVIISYEDVVDEDSGTKMVITEDANANNDDSNPIDNKKPLLIKSLNKSPSDKNKFGLGINKPKTAKETIFYCPYKDKGCERSFPSRGTLHAHLKYHKKNPFKCTKCKAQFPVGTELREHIVEFHPPEDS